MKESMFTFPEERLRELYAREEELTEEIDELDEELDDLKHIREGYRIRIEELLRLREGRPTSKQYYISGGGLVSKIVEESERDKEVFRRLEEFRYEHSTPKVYADGIDAGSIENAESFNEITPKDLVPESILEDVCNRLLTKIQDGNQNLLMTKPMKFTFDESKVIDSKKIIKTIEAREQRNQNDRDSFDEELAEIKGHKSIQDIVDDMVSSPGFDEDAKIKLTMNVDEELVREDEYNG